MCCTGKFNLQIIIPNGFLPVSPEVKLLGPSPHQVDKTRPPNLMPLGRREGGITVMNNLTFYARSCIHCGQWPYTGA